MFIRDKRADWSTSCVRRTRLSTCSPEVRIFVILPASPAEIRLHARNPGRTWNVVSSAPGLMPRCPARGAISRTSISQARSSAHLVGGLFFYRAFSATVPTPGAKLDTLPRALCRVRFIWFLPAAYYAWHSTMNRCRTRGSSRFEKARDLNQRSSQIFPGQVFVRPTNVRLRGAASPSRVVYATSSTGTPLVTSVPLGLSFLPFSRRLPGPWSARRSPSLPLSTCHHHILREVSGLCAV